MLLENVYREKLEALLEFSYCAAQEGGYAGSRPSETDIIGWATALMPSMFKVISGCIPMFCSEVFEEINGLLKEVQMKPSNKRLDWEKAAAGDVAEAVKFLMVLAYEILEAKPLVMRKICMKLKLTSQMNMAHIMVVMDQHEQSDDPSDGWEEVMTEQFLDQVLSLPAAQLCYSAKTPLKRSGPSTDFDAAGSPVCLVALQSPNRRERALEKMYNAEKEINNALKEDYEQLRDILESERTASKAKIDELIQKVNELESKDIKCGFGCESANEAARLKIRINILNSRMETLESENRAFRDIEGKLATLVSERNAWAAKSAEFEKQADEYQKRAAKLFSDLNEQKTKYEELEMKHATPITLVPEASNGKEQEYHNVVEDKGNADRENIRLKTQLNSLKKQIGLLEKKNSDLLEKLDEGKGNPAEVRVELEISLFNLKASNEKVTEQSKIIERQLGEIETIRAECQKLQDHVQKATAGVRRYRNPLFGDITNREGLDDAPSLQKRLANLETS